MTLQHARLRALLQQIIATNPQLDADRVREVFLAAVVQDEDAAYEAAAPATKATATMMTVISASR
jgi:hypothetical protein